METAKYYTPEIEEFHVGFEYQVQNYNGEFGNNILTEDMLIICPGGEENNDQPFYFKRYSLDKFRVKYLNREDIVSLGWIQRDYDTYDIEGYALELDHEYNTFIYQTGPRNGTVFKGIIKNKSELKRLMQQLKIQNA